jgi:Transposase DDE domain
MDSLTQTCQTATPDVSPLQQALLTVLQKQANALARSTGLIVRQRQLTGASFAALLILGWLQDPQATLEALVQFGSSLQVDISAQGLDQRFTLPAAVFFKALFQVALSQLVMADPVAIPLLQRFAAVDLEDSTSIGLPDELAGLFQGCGGSSPEVGLSACKLHLRLDACSGGLQLSALQDGRAADCATPLAQLPAPIGTLSIRDRGFFDLSRIQAEHEQGRYHLTYFKSGTGIRDQDGQPLDLLLLLLRGQSGPLDQDVLVGEARLPMRLLAIAAPAEVVAERRQRLIRTAQKHGRAVNHEQLLLCAWTISLTNVPRHLLCLAEALVLLRLRWQIELLIKLFKEQGKVDEWRSHKPMRIVCELFAKLIGLLIQHWLLLVSCWQDPHRSLVKAAKAVRSHAILLAYALAEAISLPFVLQQIQQAAQHGSRLNSRKKRPNTSQLVLAGTDGRAD